MKNPITLIAVAFAAVMVFLLISGLHVNAPQMNAAATAATADAVIPVNSSNYAAEVENSTVPVLVEFSATWCGPCKAFRPNLDEAAVALKGKVKVVTIDVDESPELARQWGARAIPTVVFVAPGKTTPSADSPRSVGYVSADAVEQFAQEQLSK